MKGRESGMPEEVRWESFFNPGCMLEKLDCAGLQGDILEFGCGYGTFTLPAARINPGRIIALDIDPEMVAATSIKSKQEGLWNVSVHERDFLSLGSGCFDGQAAYAMLFNILHIENPVDLIREARRSIAPGGKVGIIHWRSDIETPRGPSASIRPTADRCRIWGEAGGLEFIRNVALCCCSWHWGMVMQRPV